MPRQARIDYPGALHHVIGRGIERKFIFREDREKKEFYRRLDENLIRHHIQCYGWCIMGNHFHLIIQTGKTTLSEFMRGLLTGYANFYNRINKRRGHLFQNRYKSVICDKDEYLLPLVRYIHLNPVRAGIIRYQDLTNYKWTGHYEICRGNAGLIKRREEILRIFGGRVREAVERYKDYVKDGVDLKEDFEGGGLLRSGRGLREVLKRKKEDREQYDERILGGGEFVEEVLEQTEKQEGNRKKIKTMGELLERLGRSYGVTTEAILKTRAKRVREARDMFVYLGREYLGKSVTELGRTLGIQQGSASDAVKRAREIKGREEIEASLLT